MMSSIVERRVESIIESICRTKDCDNYFIYPEDLQEDNEVYKANLNQAMNRIHFVSSPHELMNVFLENERETHCCFAVMLRNAELLTLGTVLGELHKIFLKSNFTIILHILNFSEDTNSNSDVFAKLWGDKFGVAISQHPFLPFLFLMDSAIRFDEIDGSIQQYREVFNANPVIDENHSHRRYFRMGEKFVCRVKNDKVTIAELISNQMNLRRLEIEGLHFTENPHNSYAISSDSLGIMFRRPFIEGVDAQSFLESNDKLKTASMLLETISFWSLNGLFPNDLRPWNLIYSDNACRLIDFPRNIGNDDDVLGCSNFISLFMLLDYISYSGKKAFTSIVSETLAKVCQHGSIYNRHAFEYLTNAWLGLSSYQDFFLKHVSGDDQFGAILNEVFYGI